MPSVIMISTVESVKYLDEMKYDRSTVSCKGLFGFAIMFHRDLHVRVSWTYSEFFLGSAVADVERVAELPLEAEVSTAYSSKLIMKRTNLI